MSTFKWLAPESLVTYFTTELNSLADSTSETTGFVVLGAEIDNEANLFQYISFEIVIAAQGSARAVGGVIEIWKAEAVDATPNYPADTNAAFITNFLRAFVFDAATTGRRLVITNVPLPPYKVKFQLRNDTGQALAASGNTFKYRRHNEQVV